MLKKTIKYTDFNGEEQKEDFYFNLTKSEIIAKEAATEGGYSERLTRVGKSTNGAEIMAVFRDLIFDSYGEKSADGKRFSKSADISESFLQSAAYDVFFMELVTDADAAVAFANGIMPPDLLEAARKDMESIGETGQAAPTTDKTPSELAREQSEAQLQGHKSAQEKPDATLEVVPDIPNETTSASTESQDDELARLRAQLAARSTPPAEAQE